MYIQSYSFSYKENLGKELTFLIKVKSKTAHQLEVMMR